MKRFIMNTAGRRHSGATTTAEEEKNKKKSTNLLSPSKRRTKQLSDPTMSVEGNSNYDGTSNPSTPSTDATATSPSATISSPRSRQRNEPPGSPSSRSGSPIVARKILAGVGGAGRGGEVGIARSPGSPTSNKSDSSQRSATISAPVVRITNNQSNSSSTSPKRSKATAAAAAAATTTTSRKKKSRRDEDQEDDDSLFDTDSEEATSNASSDSDDDDDDSETDGADSTDSEEDRRRRRRGTHRGGSSAVSQSREGQVSSRHQNRREQRQTKDEYDDGDTDEDGVVGASDDGRRVGDTSSNISSTNSKGRSAHSRRSRHSRRERKRDPLSLLFRDEIMYEFVVNDAVWENPLVDDIFEAVGMHSTLKKVAFELNYVEDEEDEMGDDEENYWTVHEGAIIDCFQQSQTIHTVEITDTASGRRSGSSRAHDSNGDANKFGLDRAAASALGAALSQATMPLKEVRLSKCSFVGSGLVVFFLGLQHCLTVKHLAIQDCSLGGYACDVVSASLPLLFNIRRLTLQHTQITPTALKFLFQSIGKSNLKALEMSNDSLFASAIQWMLEYCFEVRPGLIDGDGAVKLRSKDRKKKKEEEKNRDSPSCALEELVLSNCHLDAVCVKALCHGLLEAKNASALRKLDLSQNKFGDDGAKHLKELLSKNNTIQEVNVKGCDISKDMMKQLDDALRYNNSFLKNVFSAEVSLSILDSVNMMETLSFVDPTKT